MKILFLSLTIIILFISCTCRDKPSKTRAGLVKAKMIEVQYLPYLGKWMTIGNTLIVDHIDPIYDIDDVINYEGTPYKVLEKDSILTK